jgi:hypothetical protein
MTYKRAIWSIFETGRWIWGYASIRNYNLKERAQKADPRKVISVDYRDHELRVAAILVDEEAQKDSRRANLLNLSKDMEFMRDKILRELAVPKELVNPSGSSANKATVGIDREP